jgi:membrane associated rhomboid family serine protease
VRPPDSWRRARVTLAIAAVAALVGVLTMTVGAVQAAAVWGGFIPARFHGVAVDGLPAWLTPLSATLVHGGPIHLIFNLLILLFCGRAVEPILGPSGLVILYVIGAYAAAAAYYLAGPLENVTMIGASGATSAVLGAYAILFGRNKVKIANPRVALWVHALWLAAAWIALQMLTGFAFRTAGPRIAISAHIGGFLVGLLLVKPLLLLRYRRA